MINKLLKGNAKFVAGEFKPNEKYYRTIAARQSPKVLWIGCSDSRVSEDVITGTRPGTMFVHRNVANIVEFNDVNISSILEYGIVHLKIDDIVVCGHTRCGGIAAIEDGVHENYIADWLCIASGAKVITDEIAKKHKLSREKGSLPRIHGWLYRVETGVIDVLVNGRTGKMTKGLKALES